MNTPLWISENVKLSMSRVSVNKSMSSVEEDFNNQVDRMTHSGDTSHLFPQLPLPLPSGLMSKVAIVAGLEAMSGLSEMDSHSPQLTWLWPLMSAQSAVYTESPTWHPSPGWSANYQLTGWLHWTTSIVEGAAFSSYWNRHSRYELTFPACSASAKNTICRHIECFIHY